MARVIRVDLEYEGTRYHGFALQPGLLTIQGVLEEVLATVVGHPVRVTPAGRTDAGVHARGQVISFQTTSRIPAEAISRALNARLPCDIVAGASTEAAPDFDARRAARRRTYRYAIWNGARPNLWVRRYSWHVPHRLDLAAMQTASELAVGRHDFTSFIGRAAEETREKSPVRTVYAARWSRDGDMLYFDCTADAFGRHMVRNLVGTLLWVGTGRLESAGFRQILQARDRRAAGPTAPAHGLTLMNVDYDDQEGQR